MNNTLQIKLLLSLFAIQLPTLLVCFCGWYRYSREMEAGLQGLDVGASCIRPDRDSLFCHSSHADCCAGLGQAQRLHDTRKRIGNGRHFVCVVGPARRHLRFALDGGAEPQRGRQAFHGLLARPTTAPNPAVIFRTKAGQASAQPRPGGTTVLLAYERMF